MFEKESLKELIKSLKDLDKIAKKFENAQLKTFKCIEEWGYENNNTAIKDVGSQLSILMDKLVENVKSSKTTPYSSLIEMFENFKEYDSEIKKVKKLQKFCSNNENKSFQKLQKLPLDDKNSKEKEKTYLKNKQEREMIDLKLSVLNQEVEASKSILFKANMKKLSDKLLNQNKVQQVFYQAMNDLLDQLPDVSNQNFDNIFELKYNNKILTKKITKETKKRIDRLKTTNQKTSTIKLELDSNNLNECFSNCHANKLFPSLDSFNNQNDLNQSNPPNYLEFLKSLNNQQEKINCSPIKHIYNHIN